MSPMPLSCDDLAEIPWGEPLPYPCKVGAIRWHACRGGDGRAGRGCARPSGARSPGGPAGAGFCGPRLEEHGDPPGGGEAGAVAVLAPAGTTPMDPPAGTATASGWGLGIGLADELEEDNEEGEEAEPDTHHPGLDPEPAVHVPPQLGEAPVQVLPQLGEKSRKDKGPGVLPLPASGPWPMLQRG